MTAMLFSGVIASAVLLRWLAPLVRPVGARLALVALVMVWAFLPWPLGLHGWLESYFSYFSVTTALVALSAVVVRLDGPSLLPRRQLRGLCIVVAATAVWFYPMSLGATAFDPYALGYGDFRFSSALLMLGLLAWLLRAWTACVILALGQLAFAAQLLPSNNLWDYLLDPLLAFFAFGWLVRDGLARLRVPSQRASE